VPGSIPGTTRFFLVTVGLEWGPLSLVRINEELLERKVAALVQKTEINDCGRSATLNKVGTKFRQQVAVAQLV
jgi:hypothetical protein